MYKIVVVGGPAERYISYCLKSLLSQDLEDWEACVVLDPVGDGTYEEAKLFESDKIKVVLNDEQMWQVSNTRKAIDILAPTDEDIIVTVDADDWLASSRVLSILDGYYSREPGLLITHGSWRSFPDEYAPTNNGAYSELDFVNGLRRVPFRASHLRSFKYKLWRLIKHRDLVDTDGGHIKVSGDLSFMWPMLEMAGVSRVRYIPEVLYVYNQETCHNDSKNSLEEQMFYTELFAAKPPYHKVDWI